MGRSFVIAGFVLALASLAGCAAPPSPPRAGQPSERPTQEKGYGETKNAAEERALDNARQAVQLYLDERFPGLDWKPSSMDLVALTVVTVRPNETKPGEFGDLKGYEATAHIDLGDVNLHKMQDKVDAARKRAMEPVVSERLAWAGRLLAALVALSLVVAGYLRLEELTRGYYTTLLRLGAGAVVLLTVLGLWLVAF
jgi:hypothetical protein